MLLFRIDESLKTIEHALSHGAKAVILMSHLGRPDGQKIAKYSLQPVVEVLKSKLNRYVAIFSF